VRILACLDTWGLIGGSERYALAALAELGARGHDVRIVCGEDRRASFAEAPAATVTEIPVYSARKPPRAALDPLRRAVDEAAPEVAFLLTCRSPAAFRVVLDRAPVVRFVQDHTLFCPSLNKVREDGEVCTRPLGLVCLEHYFLREGCTGYKPALHSNRLVDPIKELRDKLAELRLAQRARALLVASEYMRGELVQAGCSAERVIRLPYFTRSNGEHSENALPEPTRAFLAQHPEPLVLAPARLTLPDKGVDFLLTALGLLRQPFAAVIAGEGPARAWLEAKARDEGLAARVHFAGWLGEGALEEAYARARVVVCPSVWNEPFGLVGLEAMAHAKPAVAFAVGGIPEWLRDGETGYLAPRKNVAALASGIERLLVDGALASRLGAAGRARLEREFTVERHMDALERVLADAKR
jgi:glycosyltransferase involved in cell wall biosynthesis